MTGRKGRLEGAARRRAAARKTNATTFATLPKFALLLRLGGREEKDGMGDLP